MKRDSINPDTGMKAVVFNGEIVYLSPTAYKLLMHMINNPAGQYFTGVLRQQFQTCPTRNLRPYFEELQRSGLFDVVFAYGRVIVKQLVEHVDTAYGMPVFERCAA
ncbi:hypothetical protein P4O93_004638 [Escherichia coli]|nr:hypothetical protein [Escherichia coli]EKQ0313154.1 hypothetical protein [Escherichia coli]